jgi:hypothetical protein
MTQKKTHLDLKQVEETERYDIILYGSLRAVKQHVFEVF